MASKYSSLLNQRNDVSQLLKEVSRLSSDSDQRGSWIAPMDEWKLIVDYGSFKTLLEQGSSAVSESSSGAQTNNSEEGSAIENTTTANIVETTTVEASSSVSSAETTASGVNNTDGVFPSSSNNKIESLRHLQSKILGMASIPLEARASSIITPTHAMASQRVMLDFKDDSQKYPSYRALFEQCPDLNKLKKAFVSHALQVDVHRSDGYDFTAEYEHVYKGDSSKTTAFENFSTCCRRALISLQPSLDDTALEKYVTFMGRMCFWERYISVEACNDALKTSSPDLKASVMLVRKEPYPVNLKLFIGKSEEESQELYFWIRYCPRLLSRALDKDATPAVKRAEKKAHIAMHFCYYRKYVLDFRIVSKFDEWLMDYIETSSVFGLRSGSNKTRNATTGVDSVPAPPLDTELSKNDWRIFIMVRQNYAENVLDPNTVNLDLYDDIDEEDVLWSSTWSFEKRRVREDEESVKSDTPNHGNNNTNKRDKFRSAMESGIFESRRALHQQPTACAELLGWGQDSSYCLGIGDDDSENSDPNTNQPVRSNRDVVIHSPRPIPMPSSLSLERIKSIACSPRHTLVLSYLGNIYVCGENSEGALGLGDMRSRDKLTLLQWPVDANNPDAVPPRISMVAAASGSIGSHSMAITDQGELYGWGVPQAVGLGRSKPVLSPELIDSFPVFASSNNNNQNDAMENGNTNPQSPTNATNTGGAATNEDEEENDDDNVFTTVSLPCKHVACGGGFTVVVLKDGRVCSWGTWSHGRLGHGPTPNIKASRGYGGGQKLARYKVRPAYIRGIRNAVKVSCGEAHALCVLESGEVKAWGQNSCGQLGIGPNFAGYLCDAPRPVTVFPFHCSGNSDTTNSNNNNVDFASNRFVEAKDVCAGAYHSVVIDRYGEVWTFGARGSACLGHDDSFLMGDWGERINSVFSISTSLSKVMIPLELIPWCSQWSVPRRVQALEGVNIKKVCAGDMNTCFLSDQGHFFLCGMGPAAPPIVSATLQMESGAIDSNDAKNDDDDDDDDQSDGGEEKSLLKSERGDNDDDLEKDALGVQAMDQKSRKKRRAEQSAERRDDLMAEKACIVRVPRRPSASWLEGICMKRVVLMGASGTRCFVLLDEENVANTLTEPLLRKTIYGRLSNARSIDESDDISLDSFRPRSDDASVGSFFEQRGKADCMLIVAGKVMLCHRALLASRSMELREMIITESPTDDDMSTNPSQMTQILLPELHVDSARALLYFLYTDVLPRNCIGNISLLRSLERMGDRLRIPRLKILCERLQSALYSAEMLRNDDFATEDILKGFDMPPPTLARDLGSMVGDEQYADVRFIAEGKAIPAHRFILESRCEYFRAMFRSGMAETFENGSQSTAPALLDVVVPDSFVGFLRLLIFIYTDTLPDGSDEALLEDLLSADRYDMADMKLTCESMLVVNDDNWLDVIQVAEMVTSHRLKLQVEGYIRDHFTLLNEEILHPVAGENVSTGSIFLRSSHPYIYKSILKARRRVFPPPPSQLLLDSSKSSTEAAEAAQDVGPFPLWALVVGLILFFLYAQSATIVALGPVIPIVNTIFIIGAALFLIRHVFGFGGA